MLLNRPLNSRVRWAVRQASQMFPCEPPWTDPLAGAKPRPNQQSG